MFFLFNKFFLKYLFFIGFFGGCKFDYVVVVIKRKSVNGGVFKVEGFFFGFLWFCFFSDIDWEFFYRSILIFNTLILVVKVDMIKYRIYFYILIYVGNKGIRII